MHQPGAIVMLWLGLFTIHVERARPNPQLMRFRVRLRAEAREMIANALAPCVQGLLQGLIQDTIIVYACNCGEC